MKESYVYLLRSLKDNKFYVGWTTNVDRRLDAHNRGMNSSTRNRRPFELLHFETFLNSELAKIRERHLKKSHRMLLLFKKRGLIACASRQMTRKEVGG